MGILNDVKTIGHNIHFPYDPTILLVSIYTREIKHVYKKTRRQIIYSSFIRVQNKKCPPTGEWTNGLLYHARERYSMKTKERSVDTQNKMDASLKHYAEQKKTQQFML